MERMKHEKGLRGRAVRRSREIERGRDSYTWWISIRCPRSLPPIVPSRNQMPRKDAVKENHELWAWLWGNRIITTTIHTTKTPLVDVVNRGGTFQYAALQIINLYYARFRGHWVPEWIPKTSLNYRHTSTLLHSTFPVIVQQIIRQDNCVLGRG